jgi:DNA polymerase eta
MLERYPYLAQAPPDAPDGLDSRLPPPPPIDWVEKGILIPISPSNTTGDGNDDDDDDDDDEEVYDDESDSSTTWHDVALSIAAELMESIRKDIHANLGYTTSAVSTRIHSIAQCRAELESH